MELTASSLRSTSKNAHNAHYAAHILSRSQQFISFALDLMLRRHLLLALLLIVFAASGHASTKFWTRQRVSTLTLDLVDDPTMQERLIFGPRFVGITRSTLVKVVGHEQEWVTTQPAYLWKFIGHRVVIYHPNSPRDFEETLTFVRREGSFLMLRRKSGAIARFKMHTRV